MQLISTRAGAAPIPVPDIHPQMVDSFVEIIAVGCRGLSAYNFLPIQNSHLTFEIGSRSVKGGARGAVRAETASSRRPNGSNPNYLERIVLPVQLPLNPLYSPQLLVMLTDHRLGGLLKPMVGSFSVCLSSKMPWSPNYKPPATAQLMGESSGAQSSAVLVDAADDAAGGAEEAKSGEVSQNILTPIAPVMTFPSAASSANAHGVSVDEVIRAQASSVDTGAGVFGALMHVEAKSSRTAVRAVSDSSAGAGDPWKASAIAEVEGSGGEEDEDDIDPDVEEIWEQEEPLWMRGRETWNSSIEERFGSLPFETYDLTIGSAALSKVGVRVGSWFALPYVCMLGPGPIGAVPVVCLVISFFKRVMCFSST